MAKRKTKQERAIEAQLELENEILLEKNEESKPSNEPKRKLEDALKNYHRPLRRL